MLKCSISTSSGGCGIDLSESYVLTGGEVWTGSRWEGDRKKVSSYSATGWTHDLPDLKGPRTDHACSSYTADSGDNAGLTSLCYTWFMSGSQVLIVTGGHRYWYNPTDLTEIYRNSVWSVLPSAALPSPTSYLSAGKIDDTIFVIGISNSIMLKV